MARLLEGIPPDWKTNPHPILYDIKHWMRNWAAVAAQWGAADNSLLLFNTLTLLPLKSVPRTHPSRGASAPSLGLPEASGSPPGIPGTARAARGQPRGARTDLVGKLEQWRPGSGPALGSAMTYQM